MACCNSCNNYQNCCNSCNNRVFTPLGGLGLFGRRYPLGGISYTYASCGCNDSYDNGCGCGNNGCCGCGGYDPACNECAYCGQDY